MALTYRSAYSLETTDRSASTTSPEPRRTRRDTARPATLRLNKWSVSLWMTEKGCPHQGAHSAESLHLPSCCSFWRRTLRPHRKPAYSTESPAFSVTASVQASQRCLKHAPSRPAPRCLKTPTNSASFCCRGAPSGPGCARARSRTSECVPGSVPKLLLGAAKAKKVDARNVSNQGGGTTP